MHGSRACFVAAPKRGIFIDKNKMNMLLLVETQDDLYAEVVICGDKEYLLADKKFSAKLMLVDKLKMVKDINQTRRMPKLTCTDALIVFPAAEEKTFELLDSLCRMAEMDYLGFRW